MLQDLPWTIRTTPLDRLNSLSSISVTPRASFSLFRCPGTLWISWPFPSCASIHFCSQEFSSSPCVWHFLVVPETSSSLWSLSFSSNRCAYGSSEIPLHLASPLSCWHRVRSFSLARRSILVMWEGPFVGGAKGSRWLLTLWHSLLLCGWNVKFRLGRPFAREFPRLRGLGGTRYHERLKMGKLVLITWAWSELCLRVLPWNLLLIRLFHMGSIPVP